MYKIAHNNLNVSDLDRSLRFYAQALELKETERIIAPDGSYIIVYLADAHGSNHLLELTWLRDWTEAYNLGDNEFHMAFTTTDFDKALSQHKAMECVCFVNEEMGIYFIEDPDGYWLEILPESRSH